LSDSGRLADTEFGRISAKRSPPGSLLRGPCAGEAGTIGPGAHRLLLSGLDLERAPGLSIVPASEFQRQEVVAMVRFLAVYDKPDDPDVFDRHYRERSTFRSRRSYPGFAGTPLVATRRQHAMVSRTT
jgi:hypothetical protein